MNYITNIALGETHFITELSESDINLLTDAIHKCYTEDEEFRKKVISYKHDSVEFLFKTVDDRNYVRSAVNNVWYSQGIPPLQLEQATNVLFGRVPHCTCWCAELTWAPVSV